MTQAESGALSGSSVLGVANAAHRCAGRGSVLAAMISGLMATVVSSPGVADATCTPVRGSEAAANCAAEESGFSIQLDDMSSVSAQGRPGGTRASTSRGATAAVPPTAEARPAPSDPVLVAESMVGTDAFGPYGCEDFVDAAFGLTTETGIGHDAALSFYQSLAARGLDHHETPIPRGALVFSKGDYGNHVDISRGDGTFVSGGVQGLSPGYGDGHQIQILPTANLGAWSMYGWVYPPW